MRSQRKRQAVIWLPLKLTGRRVYSQLSMDVYERQLQTSITLYGPNLIILHSSSLVLCSYWEAVEDRFKSLSPCHLTTTCTEPCAHHVPQFVPPLFIRHTQSWSFSCFHQCQWKHLKCRDVKLIWGFGTKLFQISIALHCAGLLLTFGFMLPCLRPVWLQLCLYSSDAPLCPHQQLNPHNAPELFWRWMFLLFLSLLLLIEQLCV